MSKYLGIINKEEFLKWETKAQIDFLVAKKLYQLDDKVPVSFNENKMFGDLGKKKLILNINPEVIEEFYQYILKKYDHLISNGFVSFFRDFNNSVYGKEKEDQRAISLENFNEIFKQVNPTQYDILKRKKGVGLVEQVENMNRFEKLYHTRHVTMINLCPMPIAMATFYGEEAFFDSATFTNLDFFKDMIDFEIALKILVNINDQYHFEDDLYFGEKRELKKMFEKYQYIFDSLDVFIFTHKKIQSFRDKIPAQITSLYDALEQMKLIYKKKTAFITYVNAEYGKGITSMKFYEKGRSMERDKRVESFTQELSKYAVK